MSSLRSISGRQMFILKTVMRILVDSLCILADYWYVQTPEFKLKYNALLRGVTCKLEIFCFFWIILETQERALDISKKNSIMLLVAMQMQLCKCAWQTLMCAFEVFKQLLFSMKGHTAGLFQCLQKVTAGWLVPVISTNSASWTIFCFLECLQLH